MKKRPSGTKVFFVTMIFTIFLASVMGFIGLAVYETMHYGSFQTLETWGARFTDSENNSGSNPDNNPGSGSSNEYANFPVNTSDNGTHYSYEINEREFIHITWPFTAFTQPDFTSQSVADFTPQEIEVLYLQNGWAKTNAANGEGWVYTRADMFYVNRRMGLFDTMGGAIVSRIEPQIVRVNERQNNWLKISTYLGQKWVDVNFTPPIHLLEEFMQQYGDSVSVFYQNMATGFTFRHYADVQYFGASATKAPFALYIYKKTERGEASMNTNITFTSEDYWGGSGVIRHRYGQGTVFTQRQLLHLMLAPSDNIATRMLRRVHGLGGYTQFVAGLGANPAFVVNLTYSYLSANDAGIFLRAMYEYIESGGRYSQELKANLLANRYPFIISCYPVASKSGWSRNPGPAWHDMAIVYAPSPYVLAILSGMAGNAADRRVYNANSMFVQEFNTMWFCP